MSFISRGVWKCDDCGHEWLAEGEGKPARCPSRKCRSTHWDHAGVGVDEAAKRQKVVLKTDAIGTTGSKVTISELVVVPEKAAEAARVEEDHPSRCGCNRCMFEKKYGGGRKK